MTQFMAGGLVKIIDSTGTQIFNDDSSGSAKIAQYFQGNVWQALQSVLDQGTGTTGFNIGAVGSMLYDPGNGIYERARTGRFTRSAAATALGATTWWTPGGGKKIRLLGFLVGLSNNASLAAPGIELISVTDSVAGAIWTNFATPFVPGAAGAVVGGFVTPFIVPAANGYLLGVNSVLQLVLGTALATGQAWAMAVGSEE